MCFARPWVCFAIFPPPHYVIFCKLRCMLPTRFGIIRLESSPRRRRLASELGLVPFRSASAVHAGALARTALCGKVSWAPLWDSLVADAELHLPCVRLGQGTPWPSHWEGAAFAANLRAAALALPGAAPCQAAVPAVRAASLAVERAIAFGSQIGKHQHLQRAAACAYTRERLACSLSSIVRSRVGGVFAMAPLDEIDFDDLLRRVRMMRQHLACCAIKTYLNGWTTAGRMHLDDPGCIFGCAGCPDALLHYLFAPLSTSLLVLPGARARPAKPLMTPSRASAYPPLCPKGPRQCSFCITLPVPRWAVSLLPASSSWPGQPYERRGSGCLTDHRAVIRQITCKNINIICDSQRSPILENMFSHARGYIF